MPTTNISQIVYSIIDKVPFRRKDQRLRISEYILGIFLPKHVSESQITSKVMASQSSMSRALSRSPFTDILNARIMFLKDFIYRIGQRPKYLILDETVIGRMRTNITVVVDDAKMLLSDLNKIPNLFHLLLHGYQHTQGK